MSVTSRQFEQLKARLSGSRRAAQPVFESSLRPVAAGNANYYRHRPFPARHRLRRDQNGPAASGGAGPRRHRLSAGLGAFAVSFENPANSAGDLRPIPPDRLRHRRAVLRPEPANRPDPGRSPRRGPGRDGRSRPGHISKSRRARSSRPSSATAPRTRKRWPKWCSVSSICPPRPRPTRPTPWPSRWPTPRTPAVTASSRPRRSDFRVSGNGDSESPPAKRRACSLQGNGIRIGGPR